MESGWVSEGKVTEEFERKLAAYSGAKHAIVVNNGTSALLCTFMAHRVKAGDRVLLPDYTHVATANVPRFLGCKLSFVDIDGGTFNLDYDLLERTVRRQRPKFVVAVDVAGMPTDLDRLLELSEQYEFTLIEDAAESMGAEYKGSKVGSMKCTATLSFHTAKQLTTVEGGAVFAEDSSVAERCRLIRNHGGARRNYTSQMVGLNFRATDIQSAIGLVQLAKLDSSVLDRNRVAQKYRTGLGDSFRFQEVPSYVTRHGYMMIVAMLGSHKKREGLRAHLEKNGIETRNPWPPLHRQPEFRAGSARFPNSSSLFEKSISLPLYNGMDGSTVARVISAVRSFISAS